MMIDKNRKPTVYIETSIISYLAARINNDLRVAAQQFSTIEWWENEAHNFELYISGFVIEKARIDGFHIAVAAVHGMEYLLTWNCTHIANAVMRPRIVTPKGVGGLLVY